MTRDVVILIMLCALFVLGYIAFIDEGDRWVPGGTLGTTIWFVEQNSGLVKVCTVTGTRDELDAHCYLGK